MEISNETLEYLLDLSVRLKSEVVKEDSKMINRFYHWLGSKYIKHFPDQCKG